MEQNNKESNITKLKKTAEQKIKSKILKIIVSWIISNIVTIISVFAVAIIILFIIQLNMETVKKLWNSFTDTISQIFSSEGNTEQANRDNYSVTEELKAINDKISNIAEMKNSIPNLLNQIMYTIPEGVQLTSIQNTTGKKISIIAQASDYDQLGYFIAKIKVSGILNNVVSSSSQKSGDVVTVTIEGELP